MTRRVGRGQPQKALVNRGERKVNAPLSGGRDFPPERQLGAWMSQKQVPVGLFLPLQFIILPIFFCLGDFYWACPGGIGPSMMSHNAVGDWLVRGLWLTHKEWRPRVALDCSPLM